VIERPLMDLLNIDDATPLSISTDGKSLIVSPADPARRKKFEQAKKDTFAKYRKTLKRLAE